MEHRGEKQHDTELVTVDPRGDLTLRLGCSEGICSPKRFLVCSRTLSRVSPVLERMLYGSFAESNFTSSNWTIDLPNVDVSAFALFAAISHGQLARIPKSLSIDGLFHLTTLTHYYDATAMLAPWAERWLASIREPSSDDELEMYRVLWIARELGEKRTFEITAHRLVLESKMTVKRDSLLEKLGGHLLEIVDRIDEIRETTIAAMLALFRELSDILVVVDEKPRWCKYASYMGPHRCESMILGSVVFCLTRAGLWPIPEAKEVGESVISLYRQLTSIVIHDIGQAERKGDDHARCNPRGFLLERLQRVMADMADPLVEGEREYVNKQAQKLGRFCGSSHG